MDAELGCVEHVHVCVSLCTFFIRRGAFVPTHMPPPDTKMTEVTGGGMYTFSLYFGDSGKFLFGETYQMAIDM